MAITPSEIGKFSINDGGKSTKEASLGCCIMYGRHYHITLVCGWFLIWWPTIYRWKTIVLLYNWRLTMQCYEADWMVLGVLSKTNWLSLDEKLYFWNRSMAIHSQRSTRRSTNNGSNSMPMQQILINFWRGIVTSSSFSQLFLHQLKFFLPADSNVRITKQVVEPNELFILV